MTTKHSPTPKELIWLEVLEGSGLVLLKVGRDCSVVLSNKDVPVAQEIVRRVNGWEKMIEVAQLASKLLVADSGDSQLCKLKRLSDQALTEAGES